MADAALIIPTGEELYNMLMGKIEPDLVTGQLALLDAKYANETPEQAKARALRYEQAFAEYQKQLTVYLSGLKGKVHEFQATARQSLEHEAREKEGDAIGSLEEQIQKF